MIFEEHYMMLLGRIDGISIKKKQIIIDEFNTLKEFFELSISSIREFCIKNKINSDNILSHRDPAILEKYVEELHKKNIKFISKNNELYPPLLKHIFDAPLGLYFIGDIPSDDLTKVAVIGARKCTQYGSMNSYKFSKELAEKDLVIVSGMATGIDAMAHKGAMDGGGKTIAILGCGVDIVYPASNTILRNEIIQNGCVMSEFPPNTPPFAANFPVRNRIISGMSDAVIVVEAARRSGTIITVNQALEQGRDVYAIPGNLGNVLSEGTNNLIKEGAYMLTSTKDIVINSKIANSIKNENVTTKAIQQELEFNNINNSDMKESRIENSNIKNSTPNIEISLAPDERVVYDCISRRPLTTDELIIETKMTIQKIQYILTILELKGYIQRISGQKYVRVDI